MAWKKDVYFVHYVNTLFYYTLKFFVNICIDAKMTTAECGNDSVDYF